MKFDQLINQSEEKKIVLPAHKKNGIFEIEYDNVEKFYRYDNVGVVLMKKGTKGNFRILSTLINDGIYPCSWTIRVFYTKNYWTINVAPHDSVDKLKLDINLLNFFTNLSQNYKNIKYFGYKTFISFDEIKNKSIVEKIVQTIIEELRELKLEIIHPILYLDFKKDNSRDFRIKSTYLNDEEEVSESIYEKYLKILELIIHSATNEEKEKIEKVGNKLIKEKLLPEENKIYLDELSEKYISQNKRISISLNNILENNFDEE